VNTPRTATAHSRLTAAGQNQSIATVCFPAAELYAFTSARSIIGEGLLLTGSPVKG